MSLLEALQTGYRCCITFVNIDNNQSCFFVFDSDSKLVRCLNVLCGDLEDLGEPNAQRPYRYAKTLAVSENGFEDKQEVVGDDKVDGYA